MSMTGLRMAELAAGLEKLGLTHMAQVAAHRAEEGFFERLVENRIAQANLDVEPGVVWEELRRIRATHIEFGSKRRMQCTVLTDTQRRLLQALEVPAPEQTLRSTA